MIRAGLGREQCLRRREAQRDIDAYAFPGQSRGGLDSVADQRALHHHILMQCCKFAPFPNHGAGFGGDHFRADIAIHNVANPANLLSDRVAFARNQSGIRGYAF
jgi:hypothetical protein